MGLGAHGQIMSTIIVVNKRFSVAFPHLRTHVLRMPILWVASLLGSLSQAEPPPSIPPSRVVQAPEVQTSAMQTDQCVEPSVDEAAKEPAPQSEPATALAPAPPKEPLEPSALGLSLFGAGSAAVVGAAVSQALWESWSTQATEEDQDLKDTLLPIVGVGAASVAVLGAVSALVGAAVIVDDLNEDS